MGFDDLAVVLRSRGLRLTAPRQLVLESVYRLRHATPDQIHADVAERAAGVNITTVYRTLELLEELELITHAHLSHGAPTYHPRGEHQHAHSVCRTCGEVATLPAEMIAGLAGDMMRTRGFRLDIGHVALFGVCAQCAGAAGCAEEQ